MLTTINILDKDGADIGGLTATLVDESAYGGRRYSYQWREGMFNQDSQPFYAADGVPRVLANPLSLSGFVVKTHEQHNKESDEVRIQTRHLALENAREYVIEWAKDNEIERKTVNELLKSIGVKEWGKTWTVTVEFEGDEIEVTNVEADSEQDAMDQVSDNLSVEVRVQIEYTGDADADCDIDCNSDDQWVLDNTSITATED